MKVNLSIFKSRDIRGIYPQELNEEIASKIGQAFVEYLKPKEVVVGRDMRLSSPVLFKALTKGITAQGADVYNIGKVPTECLYFTVAHYGYDSGIMVTASVSGDTPILVKEKEQIKLIPIMSLENRELKDIKVFSIDNDFKTKFCPISYFFKHNVKKVYEVKYTGGSLLLTGDHSVFVFDKDHGIKTKKVSELEKEDFFVTFLGVNDKKKIDELDIKKINSGFSYRTRVKNPEKLKLTPEILRLMGYYLAEGWAYINHPHYLLGLKFGSHEAQKIKDAKNIITSCLGLNVYNQNRGSSVQLEFSNKNIGLLFKNLIGGNAHEKHLPYFLWHSSTEQVLQFLSGYLCDSHLNYRRCKKGRIEFTTVSKNLAQALMWLLRLNHISSTLYKTTHKPHLLPQGTIIKKTKTYVVIIPSTDNLFTSNRYTSSASSQAQRIPTNNLKELWAELRPNYINSFSRSLFQKTIKKDYAKEIFAHIIKTHRKSITKENKTKLSIWEKILDSELGVAEVKSIKSKKWNKPVYDISVPKTEAFFGGNCPVLLHNSHNPKEYNGFKMIVRRDERIELVRGKDLLWAIQEFPGQGKGKIKKIDIWQDFIKHIFSFVDVKTIKPFKVVIDAGNGMAGKVIPELSSKLPIEITSLNFKLDGSFPIHPSNVFAEGATDQISKVVKDEKADFGVIFDGDGDRVYLIDELGNFIRGDVTLLLLAKYLVKKNPGKGIAYNLVCSKSVPEFIKKWGGKPIRTAVGVVEIRNGLLENNGIMGGELSGHYIFKDNFYLDSGFIAFLILLQIISESDKKVSEITKELSPYAKGAEINFEVEDKEKIIKKVREQFSDGKQDYLDGLTVEYQDWWFNLRPSQTEPLLRLTIEADTQELLDQKQKELVALIKERE